MDKSSKPVRRPAKDARKPKPLAPSELEKVVGGSVHGGTVGL
jgi:hypothetical protein